MKRRQNEIEIINYYDKLKQIYEELENEFVISGFIAEKDLTKKILELNFDRNLINQWFEKYLLNGK